MLVLAVLLVACAGLIGHAQVRAFRDANAVDSERKDLFTFTRRRLLIRLAGAAAIAAIGVTLMVWELAAPLSAQNAQRVITVLIGEVVLLLVVAGLDLRETARTSRF